MRRFKCISLKENENVITDWSQSFTIGKKYELSEEEGFWLDKLPTLIGDDGEWWICDPACFEEVFDEQPPTTDPVNPQHYKNGEVECIEGIKAAVVGKDGFAGYLTGNVIKYIWRYESKGGVQDLEKASWYLNKLVEYEKGKVK